MSEATIFDKILYLWDNEDESLVVVEKGRWKVSSKYEHKTTIVSYEGKYYGIDQSRSGSYYSDYHYDDPEAYEVTPVQVMKTVWDKV